MFLRRGNGNGNCHLLALSLTSSMSHGSAGAQTGGGGGSVGGGSLGGAAAAAAAAGSEYRELHWTVSSVMDSSRVSTCLISMLLIVYGSFRSLNIEQEARERELKKRNESMTNLLTGEHVDKEPSECALNRFVNLFKF